MKDTGCSEIYHYYQFISFEYLLSFVLGYDQSSDKKKEERIEDLILIRLGYDKL